MIREHSEKIKPPRALAVPFELGRPLGTPADPDFQRRVLRAVLDLLEADSGPVLADFTEESTEPPPDLEGWACPVNFAPPLRDLSETERLARAVADEVARLRIWYDLAVESRRGRTTVGASGLAVDRIPGFLAAFLDDPTTASPRPDMPLALALKTATEDLKAYYLEAATAWPGNATSRELNDWFWGATTAARMLLALKPALSASDDPILKKLGVRLMVPHAQAHRSV